jgi:hypothetical protein
LILKSPLTDRWHCVTKYRERGGRIEASERADVHDRVEEIVAAAVAAERERCRRIAELATVTIAGFHHANRTHFAAHNMGRIQQAIIQGIDGKDGE